MRIRRVVSGLMAAVMIASSCAITNVSAAESGITNLSQLQEAFVGSFTGSYTIENDIDVTNSGITSSITIDGGGYALNSIESSGNSTVYQNENVSSELKNLTINGNTKPEVGIWEGAGTMTLTDVVVTGYNVSTVRQSAIGVGSSGSGKQGTLTLNNVDFSDNGMYDISIADSATVNINEGTSFEKLRLQSNSCTLNIGDNWSGEFEITMDSPTSRTLGTVGENADVSGITVSGDMGYYVVNNNGSLVIANDDGSAIRFDMNSRSTLYHGSSGFLYGVSEINVPSLDLIQGLKPSTMVQKALGGLQHPTGDAIRVSSALEATDARDMQVYLQDIYLEWPYNAPFKADGSLDVDGYQKTAESILYDMICDKASEADEGAFLGSDGNYYVLNKTEAAKYSYVLYNEPDQIWYGGNLEGLKKAWKQLYDAVHAIDPNARCAGPNFSGFNASSYDSFLSYCYDNNCLPEIISWHELGDSSLTNFYNNYNSVQNSVAKYYTDAYAEKSGRSYQPELLVNEYARHYDIGAPGGLIKWLSMFEDKDMEACMAYWGMANSLNEMAADQNSPASTWWVFHWYAQMTGEQCALTSPSFANTRLYGTTSYDEDVNMAYVLFGGSEEDHGKETVYLDNMDSTSLVGANGAANVKVYGVSFSGQHGSEYEPEVVFEGAVNVNENALKIQVTDTDEMDAFFAVITPTDEVGGEMKDVRISTLSYEAEDAELIGGATAYTKVGWSTFAASGRMDVGSINNNGDGVKFTVNVPVDGTYDLGLFYSLQAPYVNAQTLEPDASGQNRAIGQTLPFGMQIDDGEQQTLYLESTVVWHYRSHHNVDAYLTAGEHTITFTQINGNEGSKGNLQLVATIDKLDLDYIENPAIRYDFEIDLTEMTGFRADDRYEVTAVAPKAGYYKITGDGEFALTKQIVDYASDAKSFSDCATYDISVTDTVYLVQGANTIGVTGDVKKLNFAYEADKSEASKTVVSAEDIIINGYNAYYEDNAYAQSGKVITELGIGQNVADGENAEDNYIEFKVNAPAAGVYNFGIRYANDEPAPVMQKTDGSNYVHPYNIDLVERYAQIKVNDNEAETVYFRNTFSWDTFKTVDVQLELNEGENIVRIYNDNSYQFSTLVNSTAPDFDSVTITKQSYDGTKVSVVEQTQENDTSYLDKLLEKANQHLAVSDIYTAESVEKLQAAVSGADKSDQSATNKSYAELKEAISGLTMVQTSKFGSYAFENNVTSDKGSTLETVTNSLGQSGSDAVYSADGYENSSVSFDGSYGLKLGSVGSEFTVSAMVNVTNPQNATTIFFKNMGDNSSEKWAGVICQSGIPALWTHNNSDYKWQTVVKGSASTTGNWAMYTYTEKDGTGTLYINGEKIGSATVLAADTADLYMGATYWTADSLKGMADNLYLCGRQLSEDEVKALYEGTVLEDNSVSKVALAAAINATADMTDLTDEQREVLNIALDSALEVYNNAAATQAEIDAAEAALRSAMSVWTEIDVLADADVQCFKTSYSGGMKIKVIGADDAQIYGASYDDNGALTAVEKFSGQPSDDSVIFEISGEHTKLYIWDNMQPITNPITVN